MNSRNLVDVSCSRITHTVRVVRTLVDTPATEYLLRKEVIQPHLPVQLPCYDFVPVIGFTLGACLPKVGPATSGASDFHDVTGGVYKPRERIHRSMLTCGY
jgi:hypothetical protein